MCPQLRRNPVGEGEQLLKAGSYGKGRLFPTERGTPQGGVITPLTQKVISSLNE